jgi:hypothetical protein
MKCSAISKIPDVSTSVETKMLKVNQSLSIRNTVELIRDGQLSILIRQIQSKIRDSMQNSDSTAADHSTSDPDSQ